jgi:hypothetical protein
VGRTGQGLLLRARAFEAQGFDAITDQHQGRTSHLIMPAIFDPQRDAEQQVW